MTHPSFSQIGAFIKPMISAAASAVAAGAGDATETDGAVVNRVQTSGGSSHLAMSAALTIAAKATLGATKTATLAPTLQHSTTTTAGDFVDVDATLQPGGTAATVRLTLTGQSGGSTETGQYTSHHNLESLNQYLRSQVLIDLSAGSADVALYTSTLILGGFKNHPVAQG